MFVDISASLSFVGVSRLVDVLNWFALRIDNRIYILHTRDMTTTQNIKIENITVGMTIIPEGRTQAVEVLMISNQINPAVFQIGHYGKGFNVTNIAAGSFVKVAA